MPRNYKKKREGPSYSTEDCAHAVEDVINRNKTYREAENYYGVPKAVIYNRISGRKTAMNVTRPGRSQVLSPEIENEIAECLIVRSKMGLPCDKAELRQLVGEYVKNKALKTPFKEGIPGEDWYYSFMKRNPNLSLKKPEHLQKLRKDARKPEVIYQFYLDLQKVINDNDLADDKGSFVFNADESGFNCDPSRIRAIGSKGKALCRISGGSGRESITVLACVSADGKALPPLIVFKGAGVQARWTSENAYPGTLYAASTNGWMEEPQFYQWFTNGLIPYIKELRISKNLPDQAALLLYDGHCSHMSVRLIEEAIKQNIVLMKFPSHLTDQLQPLDKCVFGPLKISWNRQLIKYGKQQMGRSSGRLTKNTFSELLGCTWAESMLAKNIISGFKNTGIYPVNSTMFPEEEFTIQDLEKYRASLQSQANKQNENEVITINGLPNTPTFRCDAEQSLHLPVAQTNLSETANEPQPSTSFRVAEDPHPSTSSASNITLSSIFIPDDVRLLKPADKQQKLVIPRLKQQTYGEVLTSTEVLKRLREAEERKKPKPKEERKKPKPNRKQETIIEKKTIKCETKPKKIRKEKEESSDDESEISLHESDEDPWNETFSEDIDIEKVETISQLSKGKFVLVCFKGGKRNATIFKYVCVVQDVESAEIKITGLKSWDSSKTLFTINETDVSYINIEQILGVLPDPVIQMKGERILYKFPSVVPVQENN